MSGGNEYPFGGFDGRKIDAFFLCCAPIFAAVVILVSLCLGHRLVLGGITDDDPKILIALKPTPFDEMSQKHAIHHAKELTARMAWGVAVVIEVLSFGVGLAATLWLIIVSFERGSWRIIAGIAALLLMVTLGAWLYSRIHEGNGFNRIRATVVVLHLRDRAINDRFLKGLIDFQDTQFLLFTCFCPIAAAMILGSCRKFTANESSNKEVLNAMYRRVQILLALSAVILAGGVMELGLEYRWAVVSVWPDDNEEVLRSGLEIASQSTMAFGIVFSLFLLAVFGAAELVLRFGDSCFYGAWRLDQSAIRVKGLVLGALQIGSPVLIAWLGKFWGL